VRLKTKQKQTYRGVGDLVGFRVGRGVGSWEGRGVGLCVGVREGRGVGAIVGVGGRVGVGVVGADAASFKRMKVLSPMTMVFELAGGKLTATGCRIFDVANTTFWVL
jgi:hypothetical protein